jgi:hypothetical protein
MSSSAQAPSVQCMSLAGVAGSRKLAPMRYAHQPLDQSADANVPAIKRALCALLWAEIRPIERVELTRAGNSQPRPWPAEISITTLNHQGTASSWWNNLAPVSKSVTPVVSADGTTYACELQTESCGLAISVDGDRTAAECAVPSIRLDGLQGTVAVTAQY